jgi:ATP-dependent exoDNAse (exonuclease V) alpha subunit
VAEIHGKRNKKFAHDKESISRDCIAKTELVLKPNTRVIAVVNDRNGEYVNGGIGVAKSCVNKKGEKSVLVLFEGKQKPIKIKPYT